MTKLHNVQLLRAIAALMVVFVHLTPLLDRLGIPAPSGGVDLFFVISGFIMVRVARDNAPGQFLARRIARVVPLYWAMTLFTFTCVAVVPRLFQNTSADAASLAMSLLFIPFTKGGAEMAQPILFVGWTLNYEMFFYLLFAVGLAMGRRGIAFVFAALISLVAIGLIVRPESTLVAFYTSPLLIDFALGMGVALVMQKRPQPGRWAAGMALIASPLVMYGDRFATDLHRVIALGIPSAILLASVVALESSGRCWPRLSPLGDTSYAIYLVHPFITAAAVMVAMRLPNHPAITIAIMAGAVAIACFAGRLIYIGVERPIASALRRAKPKHAGYLARHHGAIRP